jgi:hypothetical protein
MTNITTTPLPDSLNAADEITQMLLNEEGDKEIPYFDTSNPPIATIGIGTAINATNLPYSLPVLGAPATQANIQTILNAVGASTASTLRNNLNAALSTIPGAKASFSLNTDQAVAVLTNILASVYEPGLDNFLKANGTPLGHNTQEYMVRRLKPRLSSWLLHKAIELRLGTRSDINPMQTI